MDNIIFLNPVFKQMIWGGNRLRTDWGYDIPGDDTGECWAVSAHPNGTSAIRSGRYQGMQLSELYQEHPELFGNYPSDRFPLLVKIIDAKEDLSIQVHPNDAYAKEHEQNSLGKMECWYILDCDDNASLIVGHNARTKEELKDMIYENHWQDFIREVPVKPGDFIQINPGTVHAIKGGLVLLETQQNSDITYRVYDYNRLQNGKPRELHVEKSIDVITVPAPAMKDSIRSTAGDSRNELHHLITCTYYSVYLLEISLPYTIKKDSDFLIVSVLEGEGSVNGEAIKKGDHFIALADCNQLRFEGNVKLILSTPGAKQGLVGMAESIHEALEQAAGTKDE